MPLSSEQEMKAADPESVSDGAAEIGASAAQAAGRVSNPTFDDLRRRLAEEPSAIAQSTAPAAGLDSPIAAVTDEQSSDERGAIPEQSDGIGGPIETLVDVALDMDDPVRGLEGGVDSLAEALAARDIAAESDHLAAREREADERAAHRHARFHRVAELIDAGYSLDQAVAITNANEAEIRARAMAIGRNPMEPIHRYAVLNGYRSSRPASSTSMAGGQTPVAAAKHTGVNAHAVEALARLGDDAFAEATKGDRWQKLMQR